MAYTRSAVAFHAWCQLASFPPVIAAEVTRTSPRSAPSYSANPAVRSVSNENESSSNRNFISSLRVIDSGHAGNPVMWRGLGENLRLGTSALALRGLLDWSQMAS